MDVAKAMGGNRAGVGRHMESLTYLPRRVACNLFIVLGSQLFEFIVNLLRGLGRE